MVNVYRYKIDASGNCFLSFKQCQNVYDLKEVLPDLKQYYCVQICQRNNNLINASGLLLLSDI